MSMTDGICKWSDIIKSLMFGGDMGVMGSEMAYVSEDVGDELYLGRSAEIWTVLGYG